MKKIAIFASGSGTNAEAICQKLAGRDDIKVEVMVCNRRQAGVYERMERMGVESVFMGKAEWADGARVLDLMRSRGIDLIVLAGFLAYIPPALIEAYPQRIINIHPSLLPRHGGPGMYGHHVHEAVLADGDKESGITIHYVDEHVDGGQIIFQATCPVHPDDTPDTLAARIHVLEHAHYPRIVEELA
ncbi:MAG: phosphoribosylglycinamide formyltransferase [Muribaculaceae bacterium]|nr:phosphoribosylglycinamide formyltransferase [Muribaculaceae bacterium]